MNHNDMFSFVKKTLLENNAINHTSAKFPFRNRFKHIKRVYNWCLKLLEDDILVDKEVVLVSAIFHDVGYAKGKMGHALSSVEIFKEYAEYNGIDVDFQNKVIDVISKHSMKKYLDDPNSSMELIILLEADLLDEEGALGIVWDLLAEGKKEPDDYAKALDAINEHSAHIFNQDFMVTPLAKRIWEEKKDFVKKFIEELSNDLFL